jgi:hypothetical protein
MGRFRPDGGFPHLTFVTACWDGTSPSGQPQCPEPRDPMPRLLPSVSSIAILACSPAMAQVSAADLWAEWQATSAAMGQQMTATVTQTADGLVLDNFVTRTEADGTTTTGTLDRVTMTEHADGSVSVEISNPYTATIMFPEDVGGPMITVEILVATKGSASPPPARRRADLCLFRGRHHRQRGQYRQRPGRPAAHDRHGNHRPRPRPRPT